jgi:hypothetical protein
MERIKQIESMKKSVLMKVPDDMLIDIQIGKEGKDFVNGLSTILGELRLSVLRTNETLDIHFNHEIPVTYIDYIRRAKGMPYNSEIVSMHKMFDVEYKNIFPNAPTNSVFESTAKPTNVKQK